ncbi:hypothetical protein CPB86DRAFT_681738, partial [Serendipita vermifera]
AAPSLDLLDRISGMYRLLDLVNEEGSGGIVDKVIIDQKSVAAFANCLHPGSYRSDFQVDFHALDTHTVKPLGIYGSISAIVKFLERLGKVDPETATLLLTPNDEMSGHSRPTLRPGLYLLNSTDIQAGLLHIIFWPESSTWKDGTVSSVARNRVTFMRYLTKLCDQLVCMISDEDSETLMLNDDDKEPLHIDDEVKNFESHDRLFAFSVEQTDEQEETARAKPGFMFQHPSLKPVLLPDSGVPSCLTLDTLQPRIVVGETSMAFLQVEFQPKQLKRDTIDDRLKPLALQTKLSMNSSPNIILSEDLDMDSLKLLLENGLWSRCGDLKGQWMEQREKDGIKLANDKKLEMQKRQDQIDAQVDRFRITMPLALVKMALERFP